MTYQEQIQKEELSRKERLNLLVQKILKVQQEVSLIIGESVPKRVISSAEWQAYIKRKTTLNQILDENVTIRESGVTQKKGQRKIISIVGPEARSGYKIATSMTIDGFHPSVETLPGNESDKTQAVPLVEKVIENTKLSVPLVKRVERFNSHSISLYSNRMANSSEQTSMKRFVRPAGD